MRGQFVKYFITGLGAVVLDILSLYLLKEYLGLRPVWAVVINQVFILNYVFFVNKHWSFKSRGLTRLEIARFLMVAGLNYVVAIVWMYLFNEFLNFNYLLVRIFNVALSVAWNFLLYKYWVYRPKNRCA